MSVDAFKSRDSEPVFCIWLVDDDAICLKYLRLLLNAEPGVDCSRSFPSALSLLAALRHESGPDAILIDMFMPDLNGIEAIRPAKDLAPFTKVFIITTIYDLEFKAKALAAGATDFLLKRYPPAQIIAAIRPTASELRSSGRVQHFSEHESTRC